MNELPKYNTGLISDVSPSIWLGGSIPYEVRLESGDWRPYVARHERQKDPIETMACVSFSCDNCLEIQYKFFGIDINFSDRALAKMSGTQANGNTLEKVNDTARNIGLLLEEEWPNSPKAQTWAEYYREVPEDIRKKARKQNYAYEWTATDPANLKKQLKQSPLQITVYAPKPNHAVTLLHIDGTKAYIQDHYGYQIKEIKVSDISVALKVVLSKPYMNQAKVVKSKVDGSIFVAYEMPSMEYLKTKADLEGFQIPDPIPDTDSLK